jgi:hypothetical protein
VSSEIFEMKRAKYEASEYCEIRGVDKECAVGEIHCIEIKFARYDVPKKRLLSRLGEDVAQSS